MSASTTTVRLDPDHTAEQLMSAAAARISGGISVTVRESCVHLTGHTLSWHEKQLAQESVRCVSSAYTIQNDIIVDTWN